MAVRVLFFGLASAAGGTIVARYAPPLSKDQLAISAVIVAGLAIVYAMMWRNHHDSRPYEETRL